MRKFETITIIFTLCLLMSSCSKTLLVPEEYPAIQSAIDAARRGDTVLVAPGTYTENISFNGKSITVGSLFLTTQDPAYISQTIIDGQQGLRVVTFQNEEDAKATLCGFTIRNGREFYGGGILCYDHSNPTLRDLVISDNIGFNSGGGIHIELSNPNLADLTIFNNSAPDGAGGGVSIVDSSLVLDNVSISDNFAGYQGGGLYCQQSDVTLADVDIFDNYSGSWGGGISCISSALAFDMDALPSIYLNNSRIGNDIYSDVEMNVAVDIFTVMDPTEYHASPIENFSFDTDHAVYTQVDSDLYVSPDGDDSNDGLSWVAPLRTLFCAMSKMTAYERIPRSIHLAPGVYSGEASGERFPLTFVSGVHLRGSGAKETILTGIDADHCARAVFAFDSVHDVAVEDLTIAEGGTLYTGGCIVCNNSDPTLENMAIRNCGSYRAGGALFQYSSPTLVNVTVSGCSAIYGGGIEFFESSPDLSHVTISDSGPSGIFCAGNSHVSLENSILWNNTLSQVEFSGDLSPNSITISCSDIENGQDGVTTNDNGTVNWLEGNIDADPLFVDAENGNYHLTGESPCIDAGTDAGVYIDIDGDLRPHGAGFDMGSDESIGGE